jgi:hypothetical protein
MGKGLKKKTKKTPVENTCGVTSRQNSRDEMHLEELL